MKWPLLLRTLPKLRWPESEPDDEREPLVNREAQREFPELAGDFALLDTELMGPFHVYDDAAKKAQNRFRLQHVLLIAGGALATALGAVQAALHGGSLALGIAEAAVAGLTAPLAVAARSGKAHRHYLTTRLKAERLRGEYFVFLARAGAYAAADDVTRPALLRRAVAEVEDSEEPV